MATQNYHSIKNAALITPATVTDLGSSSQPYGNLYLQGNLNIGSTTLTSTNIVSPRITSVTYSGTATATDPAGGETITINGSGFASGAATYIAGTIVSVTNFVNSTQLTFTSPAKSAGSYTLDVVNNDGGVASYIPGLTYSALPVWSTSAGSLGSSYTGTAISTINLSASENAQSITYAVTSGSLPPGLSLSSGGAITGTPTGSAATYNFTVTATDPQNQTASRNFSYTTNVLTVSLDYLVVAGGGSGGSGTTSGGGGGAGGYLTANVGLAYATTYTITVGGGGASGVNGSNSSISGSGFTTVTSIGGGRGSGTLSVGNGGSGGGSGGKGVYPGSTYLSQARQGYDGGNWSYSGGGGAGQVGGGEAGTINGYSNGGRGGNGLDWLGLGTYYAGGGGSGGTYGPGGGGGTGGAGGGGEGYWYNSNGGYSVQAQSGAGNTGGGGGGGSAATGGSGVVIIRYADTYSAASSTTGSPTITVSGGYRTYKFTSSGSITF